MGKKKQGKRNIIIAFVGSLLLSNILISNRTLRNNLCKSHLIGCVGSFQDDGSYRYILPYPTYNQYSISPNKVDNNSVVNVKTITTGDITAESVTFNQGFTMDELDSTLKKLRDIKSLSSAMEKTGEFDIDNFKTIDETISEYAKLKEQLTDINNYQYNDISKEQLDKLQYNIVKCISDSEVIFTSINEEFDISIPPCI